MLIASIFAYAYQLEKVSFPSNAIR